eukprot:CAMPEP_0114598212 /NCGR_PEP_ID=MMETSP0125-20121206/20537_1 /TAXON_ID=485358 ORGANISM="Aristerostoma sp., Strain ATCC 50986" /NCGR_SAMPLE_ID=MMETSP0125 /ASSEMBLY_ACC=CAM_ASM_000245 /LENGTH=50 /DNA_ID=CAMNT_0001803627 /DNA_START=1328 /DNA_END=1480 /DNA_ORIENTATION=-
MPNLNDLFGSQNYGMDPVKNALIASFQQNNNNNNNANNNLNQTLAASLLK